MAAKPPGLEVEFESCANCNGTGLVREGEKFRATCPECCGSRRADNVCTRVTCPRHFKEAA